MNVIIRDIQDKINNKNQNFICAIVGGVGKGKSYVGLRWCELISPSFNLDFVVFDAKSFLSLINSDRLQKGDSILWDELSVSMYSRDFMQIQNKLINHVLTTFRTKNIALFFTAPSLKFVDVGVGRLCHACIEPVSINREKETNLFKFKWIQTNPITGKVIYPFPHIVSKGRIKRIERMEYKKSKFADAYEEKRKEFANKLAKGVEKDILKAESTEQRKRITDDDIIEIGNREGIDWKRTRDVMGRFSIAKDRAYRIQSKIERVGL
jgi:hypothetical protein